MNSIVLVVLTVVLVFEVTECHGDRFRGRPSRGRGQRYGVADLIKNSEQFQASVERYLDKAIAAAKARNSTDLQTVLQTLRNTDVPQFFNTIRQKLNAVQPSTTTLAPSAPIPGTTETVTISPV